MKKINTSRPANRIRRRILMPVIVSVSVLISVLAFGASTASAHGAGTNGCTAVPDSGYGFDFHDICDSHDLCYTNKPYGTGWSGRRACDRTFRSEMYQHCKRHRFLSSKRAACNTVAGTYYIGVRIFGYPSWQAGLPAPIA